MKDFVTFQILKIKGIKSNNVYSFDKRSRDFNNSCIQVSSVNLTLYHPPSSTLLALIDASAFAFNKYPHKPYIF